MLCEAQEVVAAREARDLVYPNLLKRWENNYAFKPSCTAPERIRIDGHVKGGDGKTREQQEAFLKGRGLQQAHLEDLAAAFVAHWVATGEPLFGFFKNNASSFRVRAAGGALGFVSDGLCVSAVSGDYSFSFIAVASRALPE